MCLVHCLCARAWFQGFADERSAGVGNEIAARHLLPGFDFRRLAGVLVGNAYQLFISISPPS
jgi:hypothetical protein